RLTVSDHGPGISAADIDRVFKRFVRLNHRGNLEGSGLGLPLVRGVLQHHKGWAWVESSPGQGFTLHMALPLHYPTPRKTASTGTLSS
ncbi:MAG: sensor histidine kinase, partial [Pusillimonas sp.]